MKPIKFDQVTESFLENRLLIFKRGSPAWRFLGRLLSRENTTVASKGGTTLPPELWNIIHEQTYEENFVLVKATIESDTDKKKVLACQEVELSSRLGHLENSRMIDACEQLLNSANDIDHDQLREEMMEGVEVIGGDSDEYDWIFGVPKIKKRQKTHRIVLRAGKKQNRRRCLYAELTVPDVIARIEGGKCGLCGGKRSLCVGCNGAAFDLFMDARCGPVVVCPICVDVTLSLSHQELLEDCDWNFREEKEIDECVNGRLVALGYPPNPVKDYPEDYDEDYY